MNVINHNIDSPIMGKERKYRYNNSELIIKFGDITASRTDVIVCSDNNMLTAEGGVSLAIRNASGENVIHDVQKKVGAELGDVVVTTAGDLPHKFVFHCISLIKGQYSEKNPDEKAQVEEYVVRHSISKCLRLLTALDLSSMALPCIGAGYAGYGFEQAGRVMAEEISEFLLKTNKSYRIEIYLYGKRDDIDMMDYIAFFEQFALRVPTESDSAKRSPVLSQKKADELPQKAENKYDVFISYSRLDKEKADIVCEYLDKYGIRYWIDREGVHHGNNFKEEIIDAIESATILIFISSVNSNKSPNTVKEVSIAEKYNKVVIPIRIDDSAYNRSLEYDLCNKDWMDFQEDMDLEESARKLNENIRFYLDRENRK